MSASSLELVVAHYGEDGLAASYTAAVEKYGGYEFGSVPKAINLDPRTRHASIAKRFDELIGTSELKVAAQAP